MNEENLDTLLSKNQIPIIDLYHCGTEECPVKSVFERVSGQLSKALSEKGLAFIVNHGISEEKLKTASKYMDDFCDLSTDIKKQYSRNGYNHHGYIEPGEERFNRNIPELRHAFNISSLGATNLPDKPLPGFADHIGDLVKDFKSLASFLLQAAAFALELPQSFFIEKSHMFSTDHDNVTTLRLLYYPPIVEGEANRTSSQSLDDVIRCGAHSDYGTLTLLAQDSEGGLEVQLPGSEKWQRVGHLPGAILINCGETLNLWTDEKYHALQHRVVIPKQAHLRARSRHCIAFFCHPDNDTMISPGDMMPNQCAADDSVTKQPQKKSIKATETKVYNAWELVQRRLNETFES